MVALLLIAMGATAAAAQNGSSADTGRLLGRIVERSTGEAVSQAQVTISGGPSALSDLNGRFIFSGVAAGTINLTVQALGYASKTVTGVEVPAGDLTTLDITMESQAIEVEGIRVSAERERGERYPRPR